MSKSILEALYYGEINTGERFVAHSTESKELGRKIEAEKRYFIVKMSLDDVQRFEALEALYIQSGEEGRIALFSHGFKLGALIMMEILGGQDGNKNN